MAPSGQTIAHIWQISALHILPTVPQHLSTVSIPHFTFRIPHSAVLHFTNGQFLANFLLSDF